MASKSKKKQSPESPLLDHPLIPEPDFQDKLKAILSVPKEEVEEHIREHPEPQKRGRPKKPKD